MPAPAVIPNPTTPGPALFPFDPNVPPPVQRGALQGAVIGATRTATLATWYVRVAGNNNNGGTSASLSPERSGTDGNATSGATTFTSATANFTQADVGKGICIQSTAPCYAKIMSVTNSTTVVLSNPPNQTSSTLAWAIGGAWATLAPFLDANTNHSSNAVGVQGGDKVVVGGGIYRRTHTLGGNTFASFQLTGGSVAVQKFYQGEIKIIGDVDGFYTGDSGLVTLTAYSTSDNAAPSANAIIVGTSSVGIGFLTFQNIHFVGGTANPSIISQANGTDFKFIDCHFSSLSITRAFQFTSAVGTPLNILFDRCTIVTNFRNITDGAMQIIGTRSQGNDFDLNFTIQNCILKGGGSAVIYIASAGSGNGKPGGVTVRNCLFYGGITGAVNTIDANTSIANPVRVYNNVMIGGGGVAAFTAGQIIEDYNILANNAPRTNTSIGANSNSDSSWLALGAEGQERLYGGINRQNSEPLASSGISKHGALDTSAGLDLRRGPRPSSASKWDIGPIQRGNNFTKETVTTQSGANAISLIGSGFQDFDIPVDAGLITISAYCQYDSTYTGPLPRLMVLSNGEVGVGQSEVSYTRSSLNAFDVAALTLYVTSPGILTIRVVSGDTSGSGKTIFDTFAFA